MTAKIEIARPHTSLFRSFMEFSADMRSHGETIWESYYPIPGESSEDFIKRLLHRESQPVAPLVPETIYWGLHNGQVAGRISLRHRIEGDLLKFGGHISYEVAPSYRRMGVAKTMLRLLLQTPKAQEIGSLLLTCSPTNSASNQTIAANGGFLEKRIFVDFIGEERNHYWIRL